MVHSSCADGMQASNRTSKPSPLGYGLSPNTSPFGTPRSTGNMKRTSSGAFTQLSSTQIQELKESFQMLDKDGDGIIGKEDLGAMLGSLGNYLIRLQHNGDSTYP